MAGSNKVGGGSRKHGRNVRRYKSYKIENRAQRNKDRRQKRRARDLAKAAAKRMANRPMLIGEGK